MNTAFRYLIGLTAIVLAWSMLPMTAQAAPLPAPTTLSPSNASIVDQPVFQWVPVEGAASYEIEVALDDQFVTPADPLGGGSLPVYGTIYVPLRSYQAKTMYWHVRAVGVDSVRGQWSTTIEFTRRWTSIDEPAGTQGDGVPASRVNHVRVVGGGTTPPLNNVALQWDAIPGAAYYEVQFSTNGTFQDEDSAVRMTCYTTHPVLAPGFSGQYLRRTTPLWAGNANCPINSPIRPWVQSTWTRSATGIEVSGTGVSEGDEVVVRYSPSGTEYTLPVFSVGDGVFTIPDAGSPPLEVSGNLEWFKVVVNLEAGETYYIRTRAIDYSPGADYPFKSPPTEIKGIWSDHRREPGETPPEPLAIVPSDPVGAGADDTPVVPQTHNVTGTDFPLLSWEPVPTADAYHLVLALDRDFTDIVATYNTRGASFIPERTLDDNGPNRSYYWYALPCLTREDKVYCPVADRVAINDDTYVGRFAKHSAGPGGLKATLTDNGRQVLLNWGDALSATTPDNPGGVAAYQVQWTGGDDWTAAASTVTDNLAFATTQLAPQIGGTYRWRVRPLDGDGIGLVWARGPDFTLLGAPKPTASPSASDGQGSPPPGQVTPNPTPSIAYDKSPGGAGGAGDVPPDQPGKPKVIAVSRKALKVRWRASQAYADPVTAYVVMRATDGSSYSQVARTSARHVRLAAKKRTKYWFYVVAVSAAGRSAQSATTVFTMPRR